MRKKGLNLLQSIAYYILLIAYTVNHWTKGLNLSGCRDSRLYVKKVKKTKTEGYTSVAAESGTKRLQAISSFLATTQNMTYSPCWMERLKVLQAVTSRKHLESSKV